MQSNDSNSPYDWLVPAWNGSTTSTPKLSPMFDSLTLKLDSPNSDHENIWNYSSLHNSPLSSLTPNSTQNEFDHIFDSQIDPIPSYQTRIDKECAEAFEWALDQDSTQGRTIDELLTITNEQFPTYQGTSAPDLDKIDFNLGSKNIPSADVIWRSQLSELWNSSMGKGCLNRQEKSTLAFTKSSLDYSNALPQLPRQRFSDNSTPSKYCHICGRNGRYVALRACQYTTQSLCRKVVCAVCISRYDAFHETELKISRKPWVCTHCRGACPKRARCVQYFRNNEKRRAKNIAKRKMNTNFTAPFLTKPSINGNRKQSWWCQGRERFNFDKKGQPET